MSPAPGKPSGPDDAPFTVLRLLLCRSDAKPELAIARCVGLSGARLCIIDPIVRCKGCRWCRRGLGEHCDEREILSPQRLLASDVRIPQSCLIEAPEAVPLDLAVHARAAGAAAHLADRLVRESATYITLLADDPASDLDGLVALRLLARRLPQLRCLTASPRVIELCTRWGVKHRPLAEVGLRRDQDVVIDARSTGPDNDSIGLVRPRGKLAILGRRDAIAIPAQDVADAEIELACVWTGDPARGLRDLLASDAGDDLDAMITKRSPVGAADDPLREAVSAGVLMLEADG